MYELFLQKFYFKSIYYSSSINNFPKYILQFFPTSIHLLFLPQTVIKSMFILNKFQQFLWVIIAKLYVVSI